MTNRAELVAIDGPSERRDMAFDIANDVYFKIKSSLPKRNTDAIFELKEIIRKENLEIHEAEIVFGWLEFYLRPSSDSPNKEVLENLREMVENLAFGCFAKMLIEVLRNEHIADIVVEMERLLDECSDASPGFLRAVDSVRLGTEKKIERQKKRVRIRAELEQFDAPSQPITETALGASGPVPNSGGCQECESCRENIPGRTRDRAVLFMATVFEHLGVNTDDCKIIEQAEIISKVTGYSENTVKKLLENNGVSNQKSDASIAKDFGIVHKWIAALKVKDLSRTLRTKE